MTRTAALLAIAALSPLLRADTIPGIPGNWSPTFSAEFNTGQSDLAGWAHDLGNNGGWGNNEKEVYTNSTANAYVAAGALHIAAIATTKNGTQTYTSARLKSDNLFSQAYGLFEFRAKFPAGQGLWPAMWMMPKNQPYGTWPRSGEIDVFEGKGQDTHFVQSTLHSGNNWDQDNVQTQTFSNTGLEPANFSTTDWHTYDLKWTAGVNGQSGSFDWYVDGVRYHNRTGGWTIPTAANGALSAPFDKPFYFILNLAVGGNYVGNPNIPNGTYEMQVDYVRAYRILGDATGDGLANSADLALLLPKYNTSTTGGYAAGDFNRDGRINADDLVLYDKALALNAHEAPGLNLVPEPGAICIVSASLVSLLSRRNRAGRAAGAR